MGKLIVGNWKMNGNLEAIEQLEKFNMLASGDMSENPETHVVLCPPVTLLAVFSSMSESALAFGAQDCHAEPNGAFTGNVSAEMLYEVGADYIIVGHSERRSMQNEDNADVKAKAHAALRAESTPIICVGETLEDRESGNAIQVVMKQIAESCPDNTEELFIAYEPVWAIGTGKVASLDDIQEMHQAIKDHFAAQDTLKNKTHARDIFVLYGGSVKPENASEILSLPAVDGALIGGASLKADDLYDIYKAALEISDL